jgi:hypothetical protein
MPTECPLDRTPVASGACPGFPGCAQAASEPCPRLRSINLNTNIEISEADWTLNFGVEGRNEIEADVRLWARTILTAALSAEGVAGFAH